MRQHGNVAGVAQQATPVSRFGGARPAEVVNTYAELAGLARVAVGHEGGARLVPGHHRRGARPAARCGASAL
jgi:hypothetical protein